MTGARDQKGHSAVVLGGGVAGLAAGYYLSRSGYAVTLVERAPVVGGLCGSFESHGFTLDHGPHKLYSVIPGILDEIRRLLGDDDLIEHKKRNRIRLLGRYMDYPLKMGNLLPLLGPARAARMGLGYMKAVVTGWVDGREPSSYEDYLLFRFGRGVYELVFEPLAWKVWGDPRQLSADLARARIPSGGATELLLRLLKLRGNTPDVDAPYFLYPRRGFGALPDRLAEEILRSGGRILVRSTPVGLRRHRDRVESVDVEGAQGNETIPCHLLVSSIPLQALAGFSFPGDPEIERESSRLGFRNLCLVYLFLEHDRLLEDHWIFFPERQYPFNRLFEQKAMNEELGPRGRTAVCCDITCEESDSTWAASDEDLARRCLDALVEVGLTTEDRLRASLVRRFRGFYPIYSLDYRERLATVYRRLRSIENLILTGRLGMFNYNNSDHCLDMGRFIARHLADGKAPADIWTSLEERVRNYRIVD